MPEAKSKRLTRSILLGIALAFVMPLAAGVANHYARDDRAADWRTARRDSAGLAPDPRSTPEAVIQVYAARAFRWRGAFGVHTWIAAKARNQSAFTRFEVVGWGVRHGHSAVRIGSGVADAYWYGNAPALLRDVRGGAAVDALITRLHRAAAEYPHAGQYRVWPGPNSNTFIAYLGRALPELQLDLPPTAIGKDYLPGGALLASAPSGGGMQFSLGGLFGVIVAPEEGLELNLLGLTLGIDVAPLALKLPGLGRVGGH